MPRPRRISAPLCIAAVLVGTGACAEGGRSGAAAVPDSALAVLAPDSSRSSEVTPGVWYHFVWSPRGPFAVHLVEVDVSRCGVDLDVATAGVEPGREGGHAAVSTMAARQDRPTVVAVNGDFFTPEGRPLGPEVRRGEALRGRSRPALVWRGGGDVWIGTSGVEDGVVAGPGWPLGDPGAEIDVIGGFPELLDAGVRVGDLGVASNPSFAASRHPRTAVGFDPGRRRLWIVVVDGRQGSYSTGMSLPELADLFEGLGVTEAVNLDGGGSSVMVVDGVVVSRPSDDEGERPVVNALLLVRDETLCR